MDIVKVLRERKTKASNDCKVENDGIVSDDVSRNTPDTSECPKFHKPLNDLHLYLLDGAPDIYYIPDVISLPDEALLLRCIESSSSWVQLKTRRLQCWGGLPPAPSAAVSAPTVPVHESIPPWLSAIVSSLHFLFPPMFPPNHVLINDYAADQGILHHTDGPAYYPCAVILSLLSPAVMTFRLRSNDSAGGELSVLLAPRSLLVFTKELYEQYMHGISASDTEDLTQHNLLNEHFLSRSDLNGDQVIL